MSESKAKGRVIKDSPDYSFPNVRVDAPATKPEATKPKRDTLSDLKPGDTFKKNGKTFSIIGFTGRVANVVEIEEYNIIMGGGKMKTGVRGISRDTMPLKTIVD